MILRGVATIVYLVAASLLWRKAKLGAKGIKGQFRGVVATYVCIILCLPADYESKVRDTVCDCHVRGYWAGGTFSPRDYAKLLFTGTVSYTSIYHGLAVGRSLTPCHLAMRDSRRDEKRIAAKLSKFDNLGCNQPAVESLQVDESRVCRKIGKRAVRGLKLPRIYPNIIDKILKKRSRAIIKSLVYSTASLFFSIVKIVHFILICF